MRLKQIASLVTAAPDQGDLPYIALEHVGAGTGRLVTERPTPGPQPATGVATCQPGDVLVGKLRPYLNKTFRVAEAVYASTELMCLRPGPCTDSRWLSYLLSSMATVEWAVATSDGSKMPRTSWEKLGSLRVSQPHPAQQRAIADYLDTETARIDTLIAKKTEQLRLVGLAVASRVEETLEGRAAEHVPLRRLLAEPPQYGAGESGEAETPGWPRYIRITDLESDGSLRTDDVRCLHPTAAQPYLLEGGDVLVARSGATVGKAFIYRAEKGEAAFAGYLIRLRFASSRLLPGIFKHWTQTGGYWDQIAAAAVQATIQNVSAEKYKDLLVPLPPISEQEALLATFDSIAGTASTARGALTSQLSLLVEHRQALITAAVTGEIEVPGVAA